MNNHFLSEFNPEDLESGNDHYNSQIPSTFHSELMGILPQQENHLSGLHQTRAVQNQTLLASRAQSNISTIHNNIESLSLAVQPEKVSPQIVTSAIDEFITRLEPPESNHELFLAVSKMRYLADTQEKEIQKSINNDNFYPEQFANFSQRFLSHQIPVIDSLARRYSSNHHTVQLPLDFLAPPTKQSINSQPSKPTFQTPGKYFQFQEDQKAVRRFTAATSIHTAPATASPRIILKKQPSGIPSLKTQPRPSLKSSASTASKPHRVSRIDDKENINIDSSQRGSIKKKSKVIFEGVYNNYNRPIRSTCVNYPAKQQQQLPLPITYEIDATNNYLKQSRLDCLGSVQQHLNFDLFEESAIERVSPQKDVIRAKDLLTDTVNYPLAQTWMREDPFEDMNSSNAYDSFNQGNQFYDFQINQGMSTNFGLFKLFQSQNVSP